MTFSLASKNVAELKKNQENLLRYKFLDENYMVKHHPVLYMYYRIWDRVSRKVTLYENIFLDENGGATYNVLP